MVDNDEKLNDNHKRFLVKEWVTKTKENKESTQSYLHWHVHHCSYRDLINLYVKQIHAMSEHTFLASWNYVQFKKCKNNLQVGDILIVNDFAQNYLCLHQNEPQGMHWEHKQVTLHPTVVYFRCKDCNNISTHEIGHVSNDLKHDTHLVKKFNEKTLKVLENRGIEICKIIIFSDQAPSQYKNKTAFKYIHNNILPVMLNFFATRHGKGPCDGCAGRIKQKVSALVKAETGVVNSPQTFYKLCKEHIEKAPVPDKPCQHFVQTFEFTQKLASHPNTGKWPGLPNTRKLHSMINASNKNVMNIHHFLCCCDPCMHDGSECLNNVCPSDWEAFNFSRKCKVATNLKQWIEASHMKNENTCMQICKINEVDSEQFDWASVLNELSNKQTFADL